MLRKLGKSCAFIGKVGDDLFGKLLKQAVSDAGICTDALMLDRTTPTTLAFVQTAPTGDRDFSFYRNPGADMMLTERAVEAAKQQGIRISFDPNLRPPLWDNLADAKAAISWGLRQCDILKIADDELRFLTGEEDQREGAAILHREYPDIQILNVTAGADGSYSFYGEDRPVFVPACKLGGVIETTGAGDTFCACVLNFILDHGIDSLSEKDREDMLRFSNAAAYLVTTRKGAIRTMPERTEIHRILERKSSRPK